jgi:heme O synthase-like polyprenyltransferase
VTAKPTRTTSALPAAEGNHQGTPPVSRYVAVSDYWALTKPEVNFLIAVTTFTGFYLEQVRG